MLIFILAACGGADDPSAPTLAIEIATPQDGTSVAGVLTVSGQALGGPVEVAVDSGPFVPVGGAGEWSWSIDTSEWDHGWHLLQARVVAGGAQALQRINLFCTTGAGEPPPLPLPAPDRPRPVVLPDGGLIAHWGPDGVLGGFALDSSGNGFHGAADGVPGSKAGPLSFDGIDDVVHVPDPFNTPPVAIRNLTYGTIAIRFRYDSVKNGNKTAEILPLLYFGSDKESSDTIGMDGLCIYIGHGFLSRPDQRQIYFTVFDETGVVLCFDSVEISLEEDTWYHYAVTIGPEGHHGYLDGREFVRRYNGASTRESHAFFGTIKDADELTLGHGLYGVTMNWWRLDGSIGDLRIYDSVLTPREIEDLAGDG